MPLQASLLSSPSIAGLPNDAGLVSGFCSSNPSSGHRLPSDSASRRTPLPSLAVRAITARRGLAPPETQHAWRTKKAAGSLLRLSIGLFSVYRNAGGGGVGTGGETTGGEHPFSVTTTAGRPRPAPVSIPAPLGPVARKLVEQPDWIRERLITRNASSFARMFHPPLERGICRKREVDRAMAVPLARFARRRARNKAAKRQLVPVVSGHPSLASGSLPS